MRRRRWLIFGVVTLLVIGAGVAITRTSRFQKWYNPPVLILPQDGEVVEVRASLRDFQGIFTAVPEFRVPTDHVPDILGWLRPADYNRKPWPLNRIDELGEVVIRTRVGEEFRLRFYWTGKNGVVFTRDGVYQFYGCGQNDSGAWIDGGQTLCNAVRRASEAAGK